MEQQKQVCYNLLDNLLNTIEEEHLSTEHYFNLSTILLAIDSYYKLRNTNEITMDELTKETELAIRGALKAMLTNETPNQ